MNKFILLSTVAAFSLVSGVAGAVSLTNNDKTEATVIVDVGGKKETVKLKQGQSFDSKSDEATFTLDKGKPVTLKGSVYMIQNGEIVIHTKPIAEPTKPEAKVESKEPVKTDAVKVDAKPVVEKTVTTETKTTETKTPDTKAK